MKKLLVLSIFFSLVLSPIFFSCEKEKEEEKAPELPPISALEMDFSAFSNEQKAGSLEVASPWNYAAAVLNISVWNAIVASASFIPVTAFAESFNHEVEFLGDATWKWEYEVPDISVSAKLEGQILTDSVEWRMYLSYGDVTDFLWFKGRSAINRSGGYWVLNESPELPNELLRIDWTYESEEIGSLKYTNVKPNANDNGNYIMFEKYELDENNFDRRYTIFDLAEDKSTIIEWNSETIVGRINPYNEDTWKCWDENFDDVVCE